MLPQELLDKLTAELASAAQRFQQILADIAAALADAFPKLAALRFPRAHHPLAARGAGPKHRINPSKGGTEISAEACQRLGVPRPRRVASAPAAVGWVTNRRRYVFTRGAAS